MAFVDILTNSMVVGTVQDFLNCISACAEIVSCLGSVKEYKKKQKREEFSASVVDITTHGRRCGSS